MANLGLTVEQLKELCEEEIKNGNGDKHVIISSDDEGNSFHTLFYGFTSEKKSLAAILESEHDGTHTVKNCVALG